MNVGDQHFRTICLKAGDECFVQLIDQRFLPDRFVIENVSTIEQMVTAIREMHVRGAGLIGASAGYGMYLAALEAADTAAATGDFDRDLAKAAAELKSARPTAVNLSWAVERQLKSIAPGKNPREKVALALHAARLIADELHLSIKTIETHRAHIKEKLHLANARQVARYAVQWASAHGI